MHKLAEEKSKLTNMEGLWYRSRKEFAINIFGERIANAIEELPEVPYKVEEPFTGVYLCGGISTGKTTYAARLAMDIYKEWFLMETKKPERFSIVFLLVDELPILISAAIEQKRYSELIETYFKANVMILDDVFSKQNEVVNSIIKARYAHNRITIFTSNFEPKDLLEIADLSVLRRITQSCKMIKCTKTYGKTNNHWTNI